MKKRIALAAVLLLLIGGGAGIYFYLNGNTENTADVAVEQITNDEYVLKLPIKPLDENKDGSPPNDTAKETPTDKQTKASKPPAEPEQPKQPEPAPVKTANPKPAPSNEPTVTAEMVLSNYQPSFESLQSQANLKVNRLIARAVEEYKTKKANGEDISLSYFYSKYKSAGDRLEAKTDQAFNSLYASLRADLKQEGINQNEAKLVKQAYERAKAERRNSLISKAFAQLR